MSYCTSCGSDIPDGQGRSCSMCYGDVGHGKDRYYENWIDEQLWEQERKRLENEAFMEKYKDWPAEEPPPHKDDF